MYDHALKRGRKHFSVVVYKSLVQKKYKNIILKIVLKLMTNKELRDLKKVNTLNSKIMKEK